MTRSLLTSVVKGAMRSLLGYWSEVKPELLKASQARHFRFCIGPPRRRQVSVSIEGCWAAARPLPRLSARMPPGNWLNYLGIWHSLAFHNQLSFLFSSVVATTTIYPCCCLRLLSLYPPLCLLSETLTMSGYHKR